MEGFPNLQGRFKFYEGTSAKWIFDAEIKKMRAGIFLNVEKTKIMLGEQEDSQWIL